MDALQALSLPDFISFTFLFTGTVAVAAITTPWLIEQLQRHKILSHQNHRSMHKDAVPVGGGLVIVVLTFLAWIISTGAQAALSEQLAFAGFLALAFLSFTDDRFSLSSSLRFGVQILIITLVLISLPASQSILSDLWPVWFDRLLTGFCWLWFVNLFNFMDGIDGLAGIETIFVSIGIFTLGVLTGLEPTLLTVAIVLAGSSLGFLWWNWHPAKIFLGDAGAIPISFLLGWMLICLAINGHLVAALLLPAYFIADASLTLSKRLLRREKIWEAHKSHFYQRAASRAGSHSTVVFKIMAGNLALAALALLSLPYPISSLVLGLGVVAYLLFQLEQK